MEINKFIFMIINTFDDVVTNWTLWLITIKFINVYLLWFSMNITLKFKYVWKLEKYVVICGLLNFNNNNLHIMYTI